MKPPPDKNKRCNDAVLADTIAATGEAKAVIEHVIAFQVKFISRKITEGSFESVRVPGFGKFTPKHKKVQYRELMKALNPNYKSIIRSR